MLTPQESRPTAPVTTATRSTKCIETAQSAFPVDPRRRRPPVAVERARVERS